MPSESVPTVFNFLDEATKNDLNIFINRQESFLKNGIVVRAVPKSCMYLLTGAVPGRRLRQTKNSAFPANGRAFFILQS